MDYITLHVSYGSHTDSFTLTRNTTWSDLCTSIQDRSGLLVTRLYHRNVKGNMEAISCDGDFKSLVYGCNSWLQLSMDPTKTTCLSSNDILNTQQQDGLGITTTTQNDTSRSEKTDFTTQFESFGKLMDKYNDLIQSDDHVKKMMHQMAIRLTLHQKPTVDLTEIEARLEKRLGNAAARTKGRRSAIDDISAHGRVSLDSYFEHITPGLSRSETLPSVSSPLYNHIKRTPTAPSYNTYSKHMDEPRTAQPSSYEPRQTVKGTIQGEWPAFSSLYPPPQSMHTMDETTLPTRHDSSPSLSLLDSNTLYHHQKSPLSLYPQPPTLLPTQSERTSRSIPNWVPPSSSAGMPSQAVTMKPNAISDRSFNSNDSNKPSHRQLDLYSDDDDDRYKTDDLWESTYKRQSYKEQHRALKSQQKELERTIRHLKRQEKLDKKEYRKKLQDIDNDDITSVRNSSSLLSLSSLSSSVSSIYSASSSLNDQCLQQQNHLEITSYFPTIPSSAKERPYSDIIGEGSRNDHQHHLQQHHYGLDNRFDIDKISRDNNGGGMTFLADTLD